LLAADADKHKRIHLVQGAAKIEGQVSRFDRKSHPALSRDHETHSWLLNDSYLGLHGLLNNDCLRLHGLLNNDCLRLHGLLNHSNLGLHWLLNNDGLRLHGLLNHSNLGLHGLLNNDGLGLSFDDSDVLVVEEGSHHQVTTILTSVDKMDALLNRASGSEHSKGHVGVSDGLAAEQVLVANLDANSLVELAELLDWDLHMLVVPGGVFAAIDADV